MNLARGPSLSPVICLALLIGPSGLGGFARRKPWLPGRGGADLCEPADAWVRLFAFPDCGWPFLESPANQHGTLNPLMLKGATSKNNDRTKPGTHQT